MSDHGVICLKTGCLLATAEGFYWGDLHCLNAATLVFNSVVADGEALPVDPADYSQDNCVLQYDGPLFQRRGVFVLLAHCSEPNGALMAHYQAWGRPR